MTRRIPRPAEGWRPGPRRPLGEPRPRRPPGDAHAAPGRAWPATYRDPVLVGFPFAARPGFGAPLRGLDGEIRVILTRRPWRCAPTRARSASPAVVRTPRCRPRGHRPAGGLGGDRPARHARRAHRRARPAGHLSSGACITPFVGLVDDLPQLSGPPGGRRHPPRAARRSCSTTTSSTRSCGRRPARRRRPRRRSRRSPAHVLLRAGRRHRLGGHGPHAGPAAVHRHLGTARRSSHADPSAATTCGRGVPPAGQPSSTGWPTISRRSSSARCCRHVEPGDVRRRLPAQPPERPRAFEAILADVEALVVDGLTHWQSPNFFAYFPANASGPSILGELLSAGLGVQGMLWATSPACTELETHVLDWLVDLCGLPDRFRSSGPAAGSSRTRPPRPPCARSWPPGTGSPRPGRPLDRLVAYTSDRGPLLGGEGGAHRRATTRPAAADRRRRRLRLRVDRLAAADGGRPGRWPPAVLRGRHGRHDVRRSPSTRSGDGRGRPLGTAAWLHVDAAMAGPAAVCPEFRWVDGGFEQADSYAFNPHKWLFTNFDCDCFWVADRAAADRRPVASCPSSSATRPPTSGAVIDYRDWQVPLGRASGPSSCGSCSVATAPRACVTTSASTWPWPASWPGGWRPTTASNWRPRLLQPGLLPPPRRRRGQPATARRLNASGRVFLSHARLDDRLTLRLALGGVGTERRHVEAAWALISSLAPDG